MSKYLTVVPMLVLMVACSGAATAEPSPPATAIPIPTPELTATPRPTPTPKPTPAPAATPAPWGEETGRLSVLVDPCLTAIRGTMEPVEPVWTVYFHGDDWRTPGRNTLANAVFELVKLENIATDEGYQEIGPEMVVDLEPDIIVADSIESVVENPELSGLPMVKETDHISDHIFVLSEGLSFSLNNLFYGSCRGIGRLCLPQGFPG